MSRQRQRLEFFPWVPPAARRAIEAEWKRYSAFPNPNTRSKLLAALIRFATHPAMHTEVWEKLRREPEGLAGSVIHWAMFLLATFSTLGDPRQPLSERIARQRWAQYWLMIDDQWSNRRSGGELLSETCAVVAFRLRDVLLGAISDEEWSRLWPGDPAMKDRTHAAQFFLNAANCFQSMLAASKSVEAVLKLPPAARPDKPRVQRLVFSQIMSDDLEAACGSPYDPVVAALTAVAFDLPDGPGAGTVRGRRRMRAARRAASGKIAAKKHRKLPRHPKCKQR